ncbi:MAG: bile acid:sodium symporter family protein [Bacteroidetes bacterium]|nr:MAG: bile acid:sodium symporter family protein [Bacteroidota bacterium]
MFDKYNALLAPLDEIKLNFNEAGLMVMNITIAFIMFGVALGIKRENFVQITKNPKSVIIGLVAQFLLLPAITYLLVILLKFPVSISLGMLLVASCPGGNVSNFMTSLAKGNTALSVTLTAFSDLLSILMTPLNFVFWGELYISTVPLANPIEIPWEHVFQTIIILMGIPLVAGLWFARRFPKLTEKIFKPIKWISVIAFLGFITGAVMANFTHFMNYFLLLIPIVLIHNAVAFGIGNSIARVSYLSVLDRKTITIETGIQNSGIALVLIFNKHIFPDGYGGIAFIAAMWGIWHIASGLLLSIWWAKYTKKRELKTAKK